MPAICAVNDCVRCDRLRTSSATTASRDPVPRRVRLDGCVDARGGSARHAANGVDHQLNLLPLLADPTTPQRCRQALIELLNARCGALAVAAAVGGDAPVVLGAARGLFAALCHALGGPASCVTQRRSADLQLLASTSLGRRLNDR